MLQSEAKIHSFDLNLDLSQSDLAMQPTNELFWDRHGIFFSRPDYAFGHFGKSKKKQTKHVPIWSEH
jgi:hypothetical protein